MLAGACALSVMPVMVMMLDIYAVLMSASVTLVKENGLGSLSTVAM